MFDLVHFSSLLLLLFEVLKSSLYLSSRPLVSIRVAANTHTHTRAYSCWVRWFIVFNHLFHNCDLFLPWTYECFSSFTSIFQRFIVIWCALCHMYICTYAYIYKGFLLSSSSSSFYMIEHEWRSHKHGMSYNYILLIKLLFEKKSN